MWTSRDAGGKMFLGRENSASRKPEKRGSGGVPVWERGAYTSVWQEQKMHEGAPWGKKQKKPAGPGRESRNCHVKTVRRSVDCAERL